MSVRATDSLIADVVVASGLSNSPRMVVRSVSAEEKLITTIWFSDRNEVQEGVFPAGALDRAEEKKAPAARAAKPGKKPGRK